MPRARLRERLRPAAVASYRLDPLAAPAAQLRLEGSVFEGLRDLAVAARRRARASSTT